MRSTGRGDKRIGWNLTQMEFLAMIHGATLKI